MKTYWNERDSRRSGVTLILTVLLLAAVTILFGFGRLARYRYQIQLRLDREREIQQELVTRSAMRWLETFPEQVPLPASDWPFLFPTLRGDIRMTLCPAEPVFPRRNEAGDFDVGEDGRNSVSSFQYVKAYGFDPSPKPAKAVGLQKFVLADGASIEGETHGMYIDVAADRVPILWTESDFGFRYLVYVEDFCTAKDDSDGDLLRFGITPKGKSLNGDDPNASKYAIWVEQVMHPVTVGGDSSQSSLKLRVRWPTSSGVTHTTDLYTQDVDSVKSKGFQLAGTKATMVQQETIGLKKNDMRATKTFQSVDLNEATGLTDFVQRFAEACEDGVRLTVEVDVQRERMRDAEGNDPDSTIGTSITKIAVTPPYEYYTDLQWSEKGGETAEEVSTVIRYSPYDRATEEPARSYTYDTHGTYISRKHQVEEGNME